VNYARQPQLSVFLAALVWIAMMASWPAGATSAYDVVPSMDVVRSRLNLTPDQESQILPLFERRKAELQQTRAQVEQAPSRQEKRAALRDAKTQGDAFNSQVERLLTTQQVTEWRELRKEVREKVKHQIEEKQESQ
jgi:hypothetical protein